MRGSSVLLPALLAAPFATANRPAVRPLNEQVALVTGASSGIGLQAAKYLAAQGTAVVLAARRTDRLNAAVTEITEAGGRAVVASCDVRRGDMLKAAVTLAEEIFGGLDFVFANAGSFSMGEDELEAAEDEQLAMNVAVNLIGSGLLTLKYALPALKRLSCALCTRQVLRPHLLTLTRSRALKMDRHGCGGAGSTPTTRRKRAIREKLQR